MPALLLLPQNKGYYDIQGHSRSSRSVPIKSPHATLPRQFSHSCYGWGAKSKNR